MVETGEEPADLAQRMPAGAYRLQGPVERSGLVFARLTYHATDRPFENGLTPAADILSFHRSTFEGRVWQNGELIHDAVIEAGTVALARAGVQTDVQLKGSIDVVQVFVPKPIMSALAAEIYGKPVQLGIEGWVAEAETGRLVMRTLHALGGQNVGAHLNASILALQLAERLLLRFPDRSARPYGNALRRGGLAGWQLRRLLDYIEENLANDLRLENLAAQVHLSPFHFMRTFHAETGLTPHQWLVRRRMARAKALLAGSRLPIAEVAAAAGYGSQSALTAAFSQLFGISPGQWRKERH